MHSIKTGKRGKGLGFTLIELLVVVLIIGILAGIAVAKYMSVVEQVHFAEAMSCAQIIKGAESRFALSKGFYTPASTVATDPSGTANNPLDVSCAGMKYFTVSQLSGGFGTYFFQFARNDVNFSLFSGAQAGYLIFFSFSDSASCTFSGPPPPSCVQGVNFSGSGYPDSWATQ